MIEEDIELKKLGIHLKQVIKKDFYNNRMVVCCPLCDSKEYIKYGSYKGIQRYKCKACGKTFSKTTNSLWSYSKKNPKLWIEFAELMLEQKSLRFCAEKLSISLVTAFYWRHKILCGMAQEGIPDSLKGVVYITKMIMKESFKGNKDVRIDNNGGCKRRNIWIIAAKGDEDSMFIKPVFKNAWDWTVFYEKVYSQIEKKAYIVSYADRFLDALAKRHNKKRILNVKDDERIAHFILNFKNWIGVYHGVATKYLQRYFCFFILFNLEKVIDYMDLIYKKLLFDDMFIRTSEIRIVDSSIY